MGTPRLIPDACLLHDHGHDTVLANLSPCLVFLHDIHKGKVADNVPGDEDKI